MKKSKWILLLIMMTALLISAAAVYAADISPQIEAMWGDGIIDGLLDAGSEIAGKVGLQMAADSLQDIVKGVISKVGELIGISPTKPTFWEKNKTVIIVALIGMAIFIGMVIYDRSKTRGRSGYRRSRRDWYTFDDQDADIFGDDGRSDAYRSRRPSRDPFSDQPTDLFGDGRSDAPRGAGASRLIGLEGDYAGKSIPLSRDTLTIGRSRDCNLVMRNYVKGISKTHCAIRFSSSRGAYQIMDMGSTYGTYVNGKKLTPKTAKTLNRNDVINLGSKRVGFRVS